MLATIRQEGRESGGKRACVPIELGAHNPRVERIHELRSGRGRREQQRLAIEGATLIGEAQRSNLRIRELYAIGSALDERPDLAALESATLPIFIVAARAFARLSDVESPSGLLAVIDLPQSDPAAILERAGTILVLAGINDPGNAGTLIRSAEAFGAAGALFGRGGVDPFSPKVVRAAMGSLFRLPVATVDAAWLSEAAAASRRSIVAADAGGSNISQTRLPANVLLAVGNERRGVRDWLPRWDFAVRVPQRGPAESLNAAVAGSILLYELSISR